MIEVKVENLYPVEVMELVNELRSKNYVQGKDFDFKYYPSKDDYFSPQNAYNRYTIFIFYKDELATWFTLRYT